MEPKFRGPGVTRQARKLQPSSQDELSEACKTGNLDAVKRCLQLGGADANGTDANGWRPLLLAAWKGHLHITRHLVDEAHASVGVANSAGFTPVLFAAQQGWAPIVEFLVQRGADINLANKKGATPLFVACWKGHVDVVRLIMTSYKVDVNVRLGDGTTPLLTACHQGHFAVVRELLQHREVDVNRATLDGRTPLFLACQLGHHAVVDLLLNQDNVDTQLCTLVKRLAPLHAAAAAGHDRVVRTLLQQGADPNTRDAAGFPPLHEACRADQGKVVQSLIGHHRTDVNLSGWNGNTALHIAAGGGNTSIVQMLLGMGAKLHWRNLYGLTPHAIAAKCGHEAVLPVLQNWGADPNDRPAARPAPATVVKKALLTSMPAYTTSDQGQGQGQGQGQTSSSSSSSDTTAAQGGRTSIAPDDKTAAKSAEELVNVMVVVRKSTLLLEAGGNLPSFQTCAQQGWHVALGEVGAGSRLLYVVHRWHVDNSMRRSPDPNNYHFTLLHDFLTSEDGFNVEYVWVDYCCLPPGEGQQRRKAMKGVPLVPLVATDTILLPAVLPLPTLPPEKSTVLVSDLSGFMQRGWCLAETLAAVLCCSRIFCTFQVGTTVFHEPLDACELMTSSLGLYGAYTRVKAALEDERNSDFRKVSPAHLQSRWATAEPSPLMELLSEVAANVDGLYGRTIALAAAGRVTEREVTHVGLPELQELWLKMGVSDKTEYKLSALNTLLFVTFHTMRAWGHARADLIEAKSGEGKDFFAPKRGGTSMINAGMCNPLLDPEDKTSCQGGCLIA